MKNISRSALLLSLLVTQGLFSLNSFAGEVCGDEGRDAGHSQRVTHCFCDGLYYPLHSLNNPCLAESKAKEAEADAFARDSLSKPFPPLKLSRVTPPLSGPSTQISHPELIEVPDARPEISHVQISGKVIDGSSGKALAGVLVYPEGYKAYGVLSDAEGNYLLSEVPSGTKAIHAVAEGITPEYTEDTKEIVLSDSLDNTHQNLVLLPKTYFANKIVIVLTWDKDPEDLDSHFSIAGDKNRSKEMYFNRDHSEVSAEEKNGDGKKVLEVRPVSLDVDDRFSYGPETTSIDLNPNTLRLAGGDYVFSVHHYMGEGTIQTSGAIVKIYFDGKLMNQFEAANSVAPGKSNWLYWDVFKIAGSEIIPINQMSDKADSRHMKMGFHSRMMRRLRRAD